MSTLGLSSNKIFWLSSGITLAGLPHWQRLPIWIPIVYLSLIVARIYIPHKLPNFWNRETIKISIFRLIVAILGIAGIYNNYGVLAGRDAGVALLAFLSGLKIFETKNKRDFYNSTYLGYFLLVTNFFYSQSISTAVYTLFVVTIMTANLIDFNDTEDQLNFLDRLKLSMSLLLQSVPLLLVLFILFPRITGPLWGMPKDAYTGITGVDDHMSPGTISTLVQSKEVAFRVSFNGTPPNQSELYWRGPVLWHTDGRTWTTGQDIKKRTEIPVGLEGEQFKYNVILEPTNKKWLFGLETVTNNIPDKTYLTQDYQLKTFKPILSRKLYRLTSHINFKPNIEPFNNFDNGLQLPKNNHQRSQEFGAALAKKHKEPKKIIQETLDWFREENFIYTVRPPLISGDTVDEFLFNSRQGFCEHYAAAFTILMRAAGVPARIVTGYQGGEFNSVGNYLIVRQYHAHAWTEVWLQEEGWVRIDPTFAISPTRVNNGIESALPDVVIDNLLGLKNTAIVDQLIQKLRNTFDMMNYQWSQWVLGYGHDRQQFLLTKAGLHFINWQKLALMLFVLLGITLTSLAFYILKKKPITKDFTKKYYDLFCEKLSKQGISIYLYEGPYDLYKRISGEQQEMSKDIVSIAKLYIAVRYQSKHEKFHDFKRAVKSFPTKRFLSA